MAFLPDPVDMPQDPIAYPTWFQCKARKKRTRGL